MAMKVPAAASAAAASASTLRTRILSEVTLKEELLTIPEWGCDILVRELTGSERARFFQSIVNPKTGQSELEKFYADLTILSAVDPATGARIFEPADRDTLNAGSGTALERIAQVAKRISGLSDEDLKATQKN